MATSDLEGLTAAVNELNVSVSGLVGELQKQKTFATQSRRLIRAQWVLGILVALLSIGVAYIAFGARDTAGLAQRNANHAVLQCEAANLEGQRTKSLWEKVIAFPQPPGQTPEQKVNHDAQVTQFRADLNATYPQQDCSKVGR